MKALRFYFKCVLCRKMSYMKAFNTILLYCIIHTYIFIQIRTFIAIIEFKSLFYKNTFKNFLHKNLYRKLDIIDTSETYKRILSMWNITILFIRRNLQTPHICSYIYDIDKSILR